MIKDALIANRRIDSGDLNELGRRIAKPWIIKSLFVTMMIISILFGIITDRQLVTNKLEKTKAQLDSNNADFGALLAHTESLISGVSFSLTQEPTLNRKEFWRMLRQPLRDIPYLDRFVWLIRTPSDKSEQLTQQIHNEKVTLLLPTLKKQISNFSISSYTNTGWLDNTQPSPLSSYIMSVVVYQEPLGRNSTDLGRDFSSEPERAAAINKAMGTGSLTRTNTLSDEVENNSSGVWFFIPLLSKNIPASSRADLRTEREMALRGLLGGWINFNKLLANIDTNEFVGQLHISETSIETSSNSNKGSYLHRLSGNTLACSKDQQVVATRKQIFFDKEIKLQLSQCIDKDYLSKSLPWIVSIIGFLLSISVYSMLNSYRRFEKKLKVRLNKQRTALMQSFGLLETAINAAPVGFEFINIHGKTELQNNRNKVSTGSHSAYYLIKEWEENGQPTHPLKETSGAEYVISSETGNRFSLSIQNEHQQQHYIVELGIVTDSNNHYLGKIAVTNDVTERTELNRQLELHVETLNKQKKELEHYVFNLSHVLQEPVRRLGLFSNMLNDVFSNNEKLKSELDEESVMYLQMIEENASEIRVAMSSVINNQYTAE